MTLTKSGIDLIKNFESCKLTCYKDIRGLNTIGWGHRTDLPVGAVISQQEADDLLSSDLQRFSDGVRKALTRPVTDNQFSAMTSLAFNIGLGSFEKSTLLEYVDRGDFTAASSEFLKWDHANGQVMPGILRRRLAEQALFNS